MNLGPRADSATGAIIIGEGDTLWNIAQRYRLALRDIIESNNLEPPYALGKGRRLKLPAPVDYRVRGGDTLHSVANMFGVAVSRLVKVNGLYAPYRISPGRNLRIPSADSLAVIPAKAGILSRTHQIPASAGMTGFPPHAPQTTLVASKRTDFVWPVRGKVVSGYGAKEGGLYNDGINIAAPKGTPVAAAADGVVAYVGNDLKSYGNLVLIRHGSGKMTAYAHLGSVNVKKGMTIRKGQALGSVGATGSVSAAQLHFEIRQGSKTHDPRQYLG